MREGIVAGALCLALLAGCGLPGPTPAIALPTAPPEEAGSHGPAGGSVQIQDEAPWVKTCRVVEGAEIGELLLSEDGGEVYTLSVNGRKDVPELADGMLVNVFFDTVLETWPGQFVLPAEERMEGLGHGAVEPVSAGVDDRCGLYLQVLEDLWEADPGLNGGSLKYLGVDLSGLTHLDAGERAAVAWRFAQEHGLELVTGTWEELAEQGWFVSVHLSHGGEWDTPGGEFEHWEDGVFFSIATDGEAAFSLPALGEGEEPPELTAFDAYKRRSGLGAYHFNGCVGRRQEDGGWTYSIQTESVS